MAKLQLLMVFIYLILASIVNSPSSTYAQVSQGIAPYIGRWVLPAEGGFSQKVIEIASDGTVLEQVIVVVGEAEQRRIATRARSGRRGMLRHMPAIEGAQEIRCPFNYLGQTQGISATSGVLNQQGRSQFQWQLPILVTDVRLGDVTHLGAFEQGLCQQRLAIERQLVTRRGGFSHTHYFSRIAGDFLEDALTTRRFVKEPAVTANP